MEKTDRKLNSSLVTRLLKGTSAQSFIQLVQVTIRLAEVPLLLSFWGAQLYGEWLMLSAIPVYFSIGDGGFAKAACREMTMRSGAGDRKGVLAIYQSTWLLLIFVSAAALLLAIGFLELAPLKNWLRFSTIGASEIKIVLLLLIAHVLIGFQGGLITGGFWVSGNYPNSMVLQAITNILEFSGLAIAVLLDGGPVHAAAGYLTGKICGTALMWVGQRRTTPWLTHGFRQFSLTELKRLTLPAFASLAFPLGNALNIQGIRLVIGITLGPAAVAVFVPLRTLSRLALQPQAIIYRITEPELAIAFGAQDLRLFNRLFTRCCQLALWGCIAGCLLALLAVPFIFPVWTANKVSTNWSVYILLLISALFLCVWGTAIIVQYSTNRHGRIAALYVPLYGGIAFSFGYIGAKYLGIEGAALAIVMAEAVMTVFVLKNSLRMTKLPFAQWLKNVIHPPFDVIGYLLGGLLRQFTPSHQ